MTKLSVNIEKLKQREKKIVGCFPLYPPLELLHSFGAVPVVLWELKGGSRNMEESDKHVQRYVCSVGRCLCQELLSKNGSNYDALLMYNACDTLRNLPEIISIGQRELDHRPPVLKFHVPAVPENQIDSSDYLKIRLQKLISDCEEIFNKRFSGTAFLNSTVLYDTYRKLSLECERLVATGKLSFLEYNQTQKNGYSLEIEEQIDALKALIQKSGQSGGVPGQTREVFISGILSPPDALSEVIEAAGLRVVGNDLATLHRSYGYCPQPIADPFAYYDDFYRHHFPCTTLLSTADDRIPKLVEMVNSRNGKGFIFVGEKYCEHEYFEIPFLEKTLKKHGISMLQLECSIDDDENISAFKTRIEAFAEVLGQNSMMESNH